ncbi:MAG: S4 domain-containing protein, partial [Ginsengibacter sp.]
MPEEDINNDDNEELFERLTIISAKGQEPLRIDKFLMNRIEGATRNKIQQAIEAERVLVNEKTVKSNYKIRPEDKIVVYDTYLPDSSEIVPENIPFKIAFEDEDVMVIDKASGMVVHPGSGNPG